ncbi:MAG: hypothetical protein ACFCUI_06230 [Bernardetiaceae bacterium]
MKTLYSFLVFFFILFGLQAQTVLLNEPFDNKNAFNLSSPFFSDGANDYIGIYDPATTNDDFGGDARPTGVPAYTGFTGSYIVAEDIDDGGIKPDIVTFTWSNINISGLQNITVSGKFAANPGLLFDNGATNTDSVTVLASIDGGAYFRIFTIRSKAALGSSNQPFAQDTNFDGVGDGDDLTFAARSISQTITQTGNTMNLRLAVRVEAGNEEVAIDDLIVTGTPPAAAVAVSVDVSPAQLNEDDLVGAFTYTFTASAAPGSDLTVNFSVGGTATYNNDYYVVRGAASFSATAGTVVIPAGQTTAQIVIAPQKDKTIEPNETIILTIQNP